jgi:spermidine synthase
MTPMTRRIYGIFFLSGVAGLIYEVVWLRHAGLHLGSTSAAIGTVVATFLGGLAIGAALGGRWMDRAVAARSAGFAIAAYAALEAGIGIYALVFEPLLSLLTPVLGGLYRSGGEDAVAFNIARVMLCAVLILPPTIAMGATLPILVRYVSAGTGDAAGASGALYAVNTLGAVVGSFAGGWLLIPNLGLFGATAVAVTLNALVAFASWKLAKREIAPPPPAETVPEAAPRWIFPAYAASGFAALAYEVAWSRGLILSFGSSVYGFSLTIGCFILGLAVGGAIGARAGSRVKDVAAAFAGLQIAVAVLGAFTSPALEWLPVRMMSLAGTATSFGGLLLAQAAIAGLIVSIPAVALGAMFPLLAKLAVGAKESSGAAVGKLYAWNTAGTILGTLGASFLLVPLVGVRGAILAASAINLLVAAGALAARGRARWSAVVPMALAAALPLMPAWRLEDVATQPALYSKQNLEHRDATNRPLREIVRDAPVVFSRWDPTGLVTVHQADQLYTLRVNGKVDASNGGDMLTQVLIGHLGLMAHPDPRNVLVIGLGSGATAAATLKHPVALADAVEISPAVAEAARKVFGPLVGRPLEDPRLSLHLADARTHVRFTDRTYDVIVAEPSNLWIGGMATLFTKEQFQAYFDRLAVGGVMCQWVHGYKLPRADFASVMATFASVFTDATLWEVGIGGDYLLVGTRGRGIDLGTLRRRYAQPAVEEDLRRWGLERFESLLRCLVADSQGIAVLAADAALITDDDCHVEYSAPRGLIEDETVLMLEALDGVRDRPLALLQSVEGAEGMRAGRRRLAASFAAGKAASMAADAAMHVTALRLLAEAAPLSVGDPARSNTVELVSRRAIIEGMRLAREGRRSEAAAIFSAVPEVNPVFYNRARLELEKLR